MHALMICKICLGVQFNLIPDKNKPNNSKGHVPDHSGNTSRMKQDSRLMTFFVYTFTIILK